MEATGGRVDVGRVLGQAIDTYREYAGPLLGAAVVVIGISAIVIGVLSASGSAVLALIGALISIAATFLYTGYVVRLVQDVRDGRMDQSVGDLFRSAAPYIGRLFLLALVAGIAIVFGLILLVIPGLILITIWAVATPSMVVEDRGVFNSLGRSRELVKGDGWSVFATIIVAFLIVFLVSAIGGAIGRGIGDDAGYVVVQTILNILTAPVAALVSSIMFFDLGGGVGAPPPPSEAPPAAPPPAQ